MKYILILAVIGLMISCDSQPDKNRFKAMNPNLRVVEVTEIVQTSSYTYLYFKENEDVYWAAIPRNEEIKLNGTYYFDNWMEMKDFSSRELDKTFDQVYFIEGLSDKPFPPAKNPGMTQKKEQKKGSANVGNMEFETVEAADGGITLAELYSNKKKYDGQKVKVKGHVVKFTEAVMEKNWVHIQDGTKVGDDFDLTITTTNIVTVGDIAVFEGVVTLDKDFGYGYAYDILLEEAVVLETEKATSLQ